MTLPIIVPTWEFELQCRFQSARALPSKRLSDRPARIFQLPIAAASVSREPSERELLIMQWRRIACVYSPKHADRTVTSSIYDLSANDAASADCAGSLLATCEWLLRKQLRQEWEMLGTANRAKVLILVKRFRTEAPIVEVAELAADAAAWTLFGMYWCGASHPAALFNKSVHPPTGMVRWISQFHVDHQMAQVREIQGRFWQYLGVTSNRCDVLVRRMLKRTGCVALLRELCEF